MDGDGGSQGKSLQQPETKLVGGIEKGDDGKRAGYQKGHDDGKRDVGFSPETEDQDRGDMSKIGQRTDKDPDGSPSGNIPAVHVPVGVARKIMGKPS